MENLRLNLNLLIIIVLFLTFFSSCNNEELYVSQIEEEIIEEEVPKEETPGTEAEVFQIELADDSQQTDENMPVEIKIFENDTSIPLNFSISNTNPQQGVLDIVDNDTPNDYSDDAILYTPNTDYFGTDYLEYTICDANSAAENCVSARVDITINEVEEIVDEIASELKAFPSANGAGAYTVGGRGGVVVHVTNLNDSGAGSFREALTMTIPRIIVFDVSGVITLQSLLSIGSSNGNVTVAGQTAPEGGITIDGHRIYLGNVDQVIWRHMRFRGGITADGFGYTKNDSFTVAEGATNQIFDHCSFSWDGDETADWSSASGSGTFDKITVQRCMFGEGEKGALFGGQSTVTTGEMSLNNCLFYNITHRTPNVAGFQGTSSKIETINNVVWTIANRLTRTDGNPSWNHIGNYYDYGTTPIYDGRLQMSTETDALPPSFYTSGNKYVAINTGSPLTSTVSEMNANNKLAHKYFQPSNGHAIGDQVNSNYFTDTQHPLLGSPTTILTADQAFASIKEDVGCNARLNADGSVSDNKDVLDSGWIANVVNGTYMPRSDSSTWNVPAITSVSRPAGYDTDNDGMPDTWEIANGYNPNINDAAEDRDGDGYTNIEEFLNQVDN